MIPVVVTVFALLVAARSLFQTADLAEQGRLLDRVAVLVDAGTLRSTLAQTLGSW